MAKPDSYSKIEKDVKKKLKEYKDSQVGIRGTPENEAKKSEIRRRILDNRFRVLGQELNEKGFKEYAKREKALEEESEEATRIIPIIHRSPPKIPTTYSGPGAVAKTAHAPIPPITAPPAGSPGPTSGGGGAPPGGGPGAGSPGPTPYTPMSGGLPPKKRFWKKFTSHDININPENRARYDALFFLVIIVHLVDWWYFQFKVTGLTIIYRLMFYFLIGVAARYVLDDDILSALKNYTIVSIIPILIIPLLGELMTWAGAPEAIAGKVAGIAFAVPVWLIYLRYMRGVNYTLVGTKTEKFFTALTSPVKWTGLYFFILFITIMLNIFQLSSGLIYETGVSIEGFDPYVAFDQFWTPVKNTWTTVWLDLYQLPNRTQIILDRELNRTLGAYYTGRVEENKERTGVWIEKFEAPGTHYEDLPVSFFAIIKVRSFVDDVYMNVSCTAEDTKNKTAKFGGVVEPAEFIVYQEDQRGVTCTFNRLPAGNYKVTLEAQFNFDTWAYTTYTFMNRELMTSVLSSGEDLYTEFNIKKRPSTVYTNGPVLLGMNEQLEMPIGVSYSDNTLVPIGMTLDNKQKQYGDILKVTKFEMRLPDELQIQSNKCTNPYSSVTTDPELSGYTIYTFPNPRPDYLKTFLTVSCSMQITPQNAVSLLGTGGGKTVATIVGRAEYEYQLTRSIYLKVVPTPAYTG